MALLEKKRYEPRRSRRQPYKKKRRGTGLFVFLGLVVLTLLAVIFFGPDSTSESESGVVERLEDPTVAGPPEVVFEKEEEEVAQGEEEEEPAPPPLPEDPTLFLTVPKLGLYNHTVRNDRSEWALNLGAVKVPSTGFPWEKEDTNTYIACHRVGWPGTESYNQCLNLPLMQKGDEIYLVDTTGRVYEYRVSEVFAISPMDVWVMQPIAGRDVVSLQTCTETPFDWWSMGSGLFGGGPESGRLVVRADRLT